MRGRRGRRGRSGRREKWKKKGRERHREMSLKLREGKTDKEIQRQKKL
jgi:hypothetical protein